jgi:hypothetical protein
MSKGVTRLSLGLRNGTQIGSIGKLIDVDDERFGLVKQVPDDGRSDKSGATRDEDCRTAKLHVVP